MSFLEKNQTWEDTSASTIDYKWVFKVKKNTNASEPLRFKAMLVVKSYTQKGGVDYNEICHQSLSMLLLVAHFNQELELDVCVP